MRFLDQKMNRRLMLRAIFGTALFCLTITMSYGDEVKPWRSISDSNLAWAPPERRNLVLKALSRIPAVWYRDALHPNAVEQEIEILRQIRGQNKHVLLIINPEPEYYDKPSARYAGPEFKRLCGWSSGNLPLSGLDTGRLKTRLSSALAALRHAEIEVDAFEIGNELDWVCFNTDLPFEPDAPNLRDSSLLPYAKAYARFLEAAVETIKTPGLYPRALIVSFGTANTLGLIPSRSFAHPAQFIRMLKTLDGRSDLNLVDRVGIHMYPEIDHPETIAPALRRFSSESGAGKPIWITEWGYHNAPFVGRARNARLSAFNRFYCEVVASKVDVENMFMFSIASPDESLISTTGSLLPEASFFTKAPGCKR
ncbi:MAG TPA: glycosyl hydrolase [Candidatus Binataceae bacterium]|nr:glycosyl hydrolase [Candidatus Binataceae bacterium]